MLANNTGDRAEVQRCQIHKRRNVKDRLPENCQEDYDPRIRNAYAMTNHANAKEAFLKIVRQLEGINPSLLSSGAQSIVLDSLAGAIGA